MELQDQLDAHLTLLSFVLSVTSKDSIVPEISQKWAMKTMVQRFLANEPGVNETRIICGEVMREARQRAAVHV